MVKSGAVETLQAVVIGSLFNQLQHFLNLEIHCCDLNGRRREKKQNHHYYLHGIIMKQLLIKQVKCRLEAESKHRGKLLRDRSVKWLPGGRTTSAAIPSQPVGFLRARRRSEEGEGENLDLLELQA